MALDFAYRLRSIIHLPIERSAGSASASAQAVCGGGAWKRVDVIVLFRAIKLISEAIGRGRKGYRSICFCVRVLSRQEAMVNNERGKVLEWLPVA